ncbi:ATP-binding region [Seminavis robusta]|uniref:Diphthine--ammonia ligase n=1 Tax=Seminavis robusta TaxID=568900 RepID=A0A9N8HSD5_9STRA|nr:ATP-binding region [Seminavis robusta]|eukprot:Sro1431_g272030.1 ATP-binding region (285) ;mRNA; f:15126-15980
MADSTSATTSTISSPEAVLKAKDNEALAAMRGRDCLKAFSGQRAAISFTGGKDCHLALQRCVDAGIEIVCGCSFVSPGHSFQAHRMEWQQTQGKTMGIPIIQCPLTELESNNNDYKAAYAAAIRKLQEDCKIQLIITGDIDYVGTSTTNFMQQVCIEKDTRGVQVLLPLWQQSRQDLLEEMLHTCQLDIRLCCVKSPHFDATWIGRQLDDKAVNELKAKTEHGLDLSGENGEYHTMVVGGPMYKNTPLEFVNVKAKELLQQRGQKEGEQWWVMSETSKLQPRER